MITAGEHPKVCHIRFVDGHEVSLPISEYERVKKKIAREDYDYEHNGQMLNLSFYEDVSIQIERSQNDRYIETQEPEIRSKLLIIKKYRERHYPYKLPFASINHIDQFIDDIKAGKL